ncbi:glutathione S-transferase N-terminal domain-containing protein [Rhodobacteraceae bacterium B1Z28]|uniref:Glutathione S-transferase N-terminal domain-containing protein n=1 Tax=Ruegeria haliotis TaxID=2747601 RepID=A0ABX2PW54_9RHOB|nr:glutathione S-transferase N-terminal domain-containing protein [Ruegeria haliotis]NVO58433.1 glutathione S-transferase N-terminal domain-containing protein [Ruegeria haliotis]
MIRLFDFKLSGSCHKVRMLLSMLHLEYQLIDVDLLNGDQTQAQFLRINPLHKVPVLDDDGFVLRDSTAIMMYLAQKYDAASWAPKTPEEHGEIQQWLSFSVNEVFHGLATARAIVLFERDIDLTGPQALAHSSLETMERHLSGSPWLACGQLTLADLACYPYAALSYQGNVPLSPYPSVQNWIRQIEALPGYVAMPGVPAPA